MRYIGCLPFTGDEVIVEIHLGWTLAIYVVLQVPILGDIVIDLVQHYL